MYCPRLTGSVSKVELKQIIVHNFWRDLVGFAENEKMLNLFSIQGPEAVAVWLSDRGIFVMWWGHAVIVVTDTLTLFSQDAVGMVHIKGYMYKWIMQDLGKSFFQRYFYLVTMQIYSLLHMTLNILNSASIILTSTLLCLCETETSYGINKPRISCIACSLWVPE